jgi:hypothetical protein
MLSNAISAATTAAANTKLITSFYDAFQKRDAEANRRMAGEAQGPKYRPPSRAPHHLDKFIEAEAAPKH